MLFFDKGYQACIYLVAVQQLANNIARSFLSCCLWTHNACSPQPSWPSKLLSTLLADKSWRNGVSILLTFVIIAKKPPVSLHGQWPKHSSRPEPLSTGGHDCSLHCRQDSRARSNGSQLSVYTEPRSSLSRSRRSHGTTNAQCHSMESQVNPPTAMSFVRNMLDLVPEHLIDASERETLMELTHLQVDLALIDYAWGQCPVSSIAFASLLNANGNLRKRIWRLHPQLASIGQCIILCCTLRSIVQKLLPKDI